MKILFLFLLIVRMTTARSDCNTGDSRLLTVNGIHYLEYCYRREWRQMCFGDWGVNEATVVCRQLGYSTREAIPGFASLASKYRTSSYFEIDDGCRGTENSLEDCEDLDSDRCSNSDQIATLQCQPICEEGSVRLVGGSNYNEGRVDVCVDREWGTVCSNNQALSGAVCQKLGFYADGAIVSSKYSTESAPDNICTVLAGGELSCVRRTNTGCSTELGVECRRLNCNEHYTQLDNLRCSYTQAPTTACPTTIPSTTPTIPENTCPPPVIITMMRPPKTTPCSCPPRATPTTQPSSPTKTSTTTIPCKNSDTTTTPPSVKVNNFANTQSANTSSFMPMTVSTVMNIALGLLTGLLAILLLVTTIALVITCAALKQKRKSTQETESRPAAQDVRRQPLPLPVSANLKRNPAYGDTENAYEIVDIVNNNN